MRMIKFLVVFLWWAVFSLQSAEGQDRRFGAGVVVGFNYANLEENQMGAYYGLNAGLIGQIALTERWQLAVELLYSLNGEYVAPASYPQTLYGKVSLHHIEVPLHLNWQIKKWDKPWTYKMDVSLGLAYAVLMDYYAEDFRETDLTDRITYDDNYAIMAQGGLTYYFSKHLGVNLRATLPITEKGMNGTIAARLIYLI